MVASTRHFSNRFHEISHLYSLAADVVDAFYFAVVPHSRRQNNAIILLVSMDYDDLLVVAFLSLSATNTFESGLDNPKPSQAKPRTYQVWHDMVWCDWKLSCISTDSSTKAELRASILCGSYTCSKSSRAYATFSPYNVKQPSECLLCCLQKNFIWKYCC